MILECTVNQGHIYINLIKKTKVERWCTAVFWWRGLNISTSSCVTVWLVILKRAKQWQRTCQCKCPSWSLLLNVVGWPCRSAGECESGCATDLQWCVINDSNGPLGQDMGTFPQHLFLKHLKKVFIIIATLENSVFSQLQQFLVCFAYLFGHIRFIFLKNSVPFGLGE